MRHTLTLLPAALLLAALPALPALAQVGGQGIVRGQQQQRPQVGPAPALPGLATRRAPAPIEGDPSANLSPNAALFDAISRGDLNAARDAVGRGADLESRNRLGLSPIDAAVDQGRNDIAFYLLSARDVSRAPMPPGPGTPAGERILDAVPAAPVARPPARREPSNAALAAAAATQQSAPRGARLWAGDGGAPQPQIGFLGFDAGRPEGAVAPGAPPRRPGRG